GSFIRPKAFPHRGTPSATTAPNNRRTRRISLRVMKKRRRPSRAIKEKPPARVATKEANRSRDNRRRVAKKESLARKAIQVKQVTNWSLDRNNTRRTRIAKKMVSSVAKRRRRKRKAVR